VGGCRLNSSGSGQRPVADSYEHGNELSGSIKLGKFRDYELLKKDFAPCS
jgi:hypothetical protein